LCPLVIFPATRNKIIDMCDGWCQLKLSCFCTKDSFEFDLLHFSGKKSGKDGGTGIDYF
jgi:hypothetical protein